LVGDNIGHALVEIVVELAESRISTNDLVGLRIGDVITTEKDMHSPLLVKVAGKPKFFAEPGAYKGRKAIQVTEIANPRHVKVG
jgi:flagellar motor switch protein FliM